MKRGSGTSRLFRHAAGGSALLATLLGLAVPADAGAQEQAPQLTCYRMVLDSGLTNEYAATQLCRGARSTAPAQCFLRVQDEGSLTQGQAVQLCQFSTPEDDPATCYLQTRRRTFIESWRGVQLCQPPVQELLRYCPVFVQ
ncbi:hypothetical protein HPC49_08295 [Pyxidicoccus fallax]|uniref:Uncharacterized protein n=1 Tax=Pyxidicoccus fallax TaxID=394095 RepID=A0A848LGH4_9BACT|nr:hypothetical protein [Pyxidicoccus fallax]NMO15058.1 hypothetical protein [Pyxidicoccus fallax]NPC78254.1 hypothetical protein [Pyxidicoccus fallax]